jgi:hypothetical protein
MAGDGEHRGWGAEASSSTPSTSEYLRSRGLGLSLVACRIELTHLGRRITCPLHRPEEPGRITWADPTAAMDTRRTAVQR